jgi:cytochrome P450
MSFWATGPPADPYFDPRLDAWIFSRYRDVAAALREPLLIPSMARSSTPAVAIESAVHAKFRVQALRALSPAAIQPWEERFARAADRLADALPTGGPVDLIERYARPWSLQVAAIAAGISADHCERLASLARAVFDAAGEPYDQALAAHSQKATVELAAFFKDSPPWTVQMFAALAHSLPALLGNLWLALLEQPAEMEELLRIAGPAKAQFRQAVGPVTIGECTIERDQHLILRLDIANADADPAAGHLAFGTGLHACVGAALVKSAAVIATKALFDRFHCGEHTLVPVDRFAMRYLSSLTVRLSLSSQNPNRIDPRRP